MTTPKIVVVSPTFGPEMRDHGRCMRALEAKGLTIVQLPDCPYIDMARAALVEMAFQHEPTADVILWIDHDILFNADAAVKMATNCHEGPYDVLGALYSMRRPKFTTIGRPAKGTGRVTFYQPGLIDAMFVGMGFTATRVSVFKKLAETLPYLYCPTVGRKVYPSFAYAQEDGSYLGEDISFCGRAEKAGFRIGIDCEPRVFHRGAYDYALEDTGLAVPDLSPLIIEFNDDKNDVGISDITNRLLSNYNPSAKAAE